MIDENINEDLEAQDLSQDVLAVDAANQVLVDDEKPRKKRKSRWAHVTGEENVGRLDYKYEDIVDFEKQLQELKAQLKSGTVKWENLSEKEKEGLNALDQYLKLKEVKVTPKKSDYQNNLENYLKDYLQNNLEDYSQEAEFWKNMAYASGGKIGVPEPKPVWKSALGLPDKPMTERDLSLMYEPQQGTDASGKERFLRVGTIFYDEASNTYQEWKLKSVESDSEFIPTEFVGVPIEDTKTVAKLNKQNKTQASISTSGQIYASENGNQYVVENGYWKVKGPENAYYYFITDPNLIKKINSKFGQNLPAPDKTKSKELINLNNIDREFVNDVYKTFSDDDEISDWAGLKAEEGPLGTFNDKSSQYRTQSKIKSFLEKYGSDYNISIEADNPFLDEMTGGFTDRFNMTERSITIQTKRGEKRFYVDDENLISDIQDFLIANAKPSYTGVAPVKKETKPEKELSWLDPKKYEKEGRIIQPKEKFKIESPDVYNFDQAIISDNTKVYNYFEATNRIQKEKLDAEEKIYGPGAMLLNREQKEKILVEKNKPIIEKERTQLLQIIGNKKLQAATEYFSAPNFTPSSYSIDVARALKTENNSIKTRLEDFKKNQSLFTEKQDLITQMGKDAADIKNLALQYKNLISKGEISVGDAENILRQKQSEFNERYSFVNEQYLQDLQNEQAKLIKDANELSNSAGAIELISSNAQYAAGIAMMKSKDQGSFMGGLFKSIVGGIVDIPGFVFGVLGDIEDLGTGSTGKASSGKAGRDAFSDLTTFLVGTGTSEEYEADANLLYKATTGLARSVVQSAVGGNFALFGGGYNEMATQLDKTDMTAAEKILASSIYGTVSMALEKYGLDEIFGKSGMGSAVSRYIMKRTVQGLTKDMSKEAVEALVTNEIKLFIADKGIKITAAGFAEGFTESLQTGAEYGTKATIEAIRGETMFKDAAGNDAVTWKNLGKDMLESFVVGAIGGHTVSLISQSASVVSRGMKALYTKEEREALVAAARAAGMDELVVANLQAGLLSGKYSKKGAQSILENFKIIKQKVNTIPKEMPVQEQAVALDLILERDALNSQSEGVDPALAAPMTERVKEINETLKQIGYAVQEPSTESVLQRQQEGTGETGGERKGVEPIVQGKEVTKEGSQEKVDISESEAVSVHTPKKLFKDRLERIKENQEGKRRAAHTQSAEGYVVSLKSDEFNETDDQGRPIEAGAEVYLNEDEVAEIKKIEQKAKMKLIDNVQKNEALQEVYRDAFKRALDTYEIVDDAKFETTVEARRNNYKAEITPTAIVSDETTKTSEEVTPVKEEVVPGATARIADVDIIYPTEPQAEERKAFRSTSEYVENASKELPIEDVEELTKELDGDFGLLTAENPMAQPLTEEENKQLNQKAEEWLTERGYKPRRVTGKYGQAENSFFVPNLTRQDAIEFAKQFNQEAVAHSDGLVYQDGSMNPRVKADDNLSFTESYSPDSDFVSVVNTKDGLKTFSIGYDFGQKVMPEQQTTAQVAPEVTITPETSQTVAERINNETDENRKKVFTAVQKVLSAIPNARIILHENTDSFVDGVAKSANTTKEDAKNQGADTFRGAYVNGDIHINLETAGVTTVFHEAFHDILAKKGMDNNALLDMAKGLKSVISDKALKQRLDEFISNYEEGDRSEEYTAELGAIMAEAQKELSTTKFQQFKTLINKIAKKLGLPVVFSAAATAQDAVDFMNSMAGKLGKGEQIEVGEVKGKTGINAKKIKAQRTAPGNKLFNEPLKDAETISKSYMKSVGMDYVPVEKITKLDENLSKRISDAYDKMKNDPNDPKVKAAYEAMAKETLDQYNAIIDKGYKVEINNTEPYSDSGAMIEDLRDNKRMKIFSTESGFGDEPITDEQRKENPLLRDSGFKDVNGETLLVNDVFRFVHDFFGHAKLGNGFGPIGEENAWRVHSEMYSPEARKAMTSETRGQNSWVNFSGVNDAVFKKRDKARQLRKEGKIEEANKLVGEVYENMKFADQKVGILPEFAFEEGRPSKIKAQKPSKQDAIQKAKDKYELSVEKRGNSHQQGVNAAIADLQKSDWYAKADDTQRENAVREIKKFFGEKLKSAPSVAKITGKTKDTAVVSDLAAALRDQIRLEAKAAREATKDVNERRKALGIAIKNVIKNYKGKISEKQLSAINDRISKVNLLNDEIVDRVIDYVDKVMKDADYKEKLNKAKSARATIKKLKKDSNRQAEVRAMATAFASIDPDLVEDIDEYMAIAEKVKNALKPTSISVSETIKFSDVYSYVDQVLEKQENIEKERLLSNNPSLVEQGIIDNSMSLKDMKSKIRKVNEQKNKLNKTTNSEELKDNLKNEINSLKDILKSMVFGYNPVTDESVEMTDRVKQVIKEIYKLDVDDMTTEQMIALVDSLNNFVKNGTIGGLDAAQKTYVGIKNANDLKRKGFVARQLKAYFSPMLGRLLGFEGMSLNELFNRLFGGVTRGNEFMEKSGVEGVVMGVNKAKRMSNAYQELYANTFKNIKGFFDQENVYERGVLAFISRTNSIKPEEANKEFNRRIDLLLESYESLKNGTAEEQKMAEVYKKVFDRLNIESREMGVIESNAKQFNIAGAAWWMGTWENHYQDLYDVSLSIYNTDLGSDFYYTSDRLSKLSESSEESFDKDLVERGSSFLINTDNEKITDKSKAGVLIASTYPTTLKDKGRYVNLNFDINQSQALSGALVDIETAGAIRQVDSFINSDSFKSIIPNSSDRSLVVNRINKYIRRSKNKLLVPKDYARVIDKVINEAGRFGTTMALGGVFQFILQSFSVGINTLIQAGKYTQIYTGKSFNDWMNSTGTPTANRGVESVTSIENKMNAIDPIKSTLQQVARQYQKLTQVYMKTFLSKPDVFVARSAWKSYYLKYLSENGYDTKKINWDTWNDTIKEEGIEDLHKKAMLFAENMVSRQQNVSDERLAGETFSSEDGLRKAFRKIMLPFAGFSVNQRMRLANDVITLTSARKVSSEEDKVIAAKSLAGTIAEQTTFNFIKFQIGKLIYYGAMSILGYDDDDEDEEEAKKRELNALKYPIKSFIGDMSSPAPFLDDFMVWAIDKGIKPFTEPSESEINDAVNEENEIRGIVFGKYPMNKDEKEEFIKKYKEDNTFSLESFKNDNGKYGLISVGSDAYEALYESLKMNDGKYTEEFQGKETEKYLTKDQIESQKIFSALKLFNFIGVLPREANQLADKGTRKIKQNSLTKNQYYSYKEFKQEFKREPKPYEIDIIKSTPYIIKEGYEEGSNQKMLENIYNIDQWGGLSNQQGKIYAKLLSTGMEITPQVYELIQKGKTVDQIRKIIIKD